MTKYLIIALALLSAGLTATGWLLKSAYEQNAVLSHTNSELDETITAYQERESTAAAERAERDQIILDLRNDEQTARSQALVANRRLRNALKDSDCAARPVPIVAARVLCSAEGYQSPHCQKIRADPGTSTPTVTDTAAGRAVLR